MCPFVYYNYVCVSVSLLPTDVQVGFEQREYIVREDSPGVEICVGHKKCLEREVTIEVTTNEITGLKEKII